jgi:hypothetical protein
MWCNPLHPRRASPFAASPPTERSIPGPAGSPVPGFSGDGGPPLQANSALPSSSRPAATGACISRTRVTTGSGEVDPAGAAINTIAGNGQATDSGDGGPATSAGVSGPWSVLVDAAGNLYIGNVDVVRKVSPSGVIGTYAGTGQYGFSGDGGPATAAHCLRGYPAWRWIPQTTCIWWTRATAASARCSPQPVPPLLVRHFRDFQSGGYRFHGHTQTFVLTNSGQAR